MRVLMAEDLQSVREHLSGLLAEARDIEVRFAEQEAAALAQLAAEWRPDIVILDIRMRGKMTLGILESLKADRPRTTVVVSGFFFEPYYREAFLRHGADFFFDKTLEWNELLRFLRRRQERTAEARIHASSEPAQARGAAKYGTA